MDIIISNSDMRPIYEQIMSQIKSQIIQGKLKEGDALPSMRSLARELRISVITTKRAYEELEREGYIVSVMGKGSYVSKRNIQLIYEEQLKNIEDCMQKAIHIACQSGVSKEQLLSMLEILYEEK